MVSDGEGDVDEHLPVQALPNRPHHRKGSGVPELRRAKKCLGRAAVCLSSGGRRRAQAHVGGNRV
jgi:hypothetical protein